MTASGISKHRDRWETGRNNETESKEEIQEWDRERGEEETIQTIETAKRNTGQNKGYCTK